MKIFSGYGAVADTVIIAKLVVEDFWPGGSKLKKGKEKENRTPNQGRTRAANSATFRSPGAL